MLRAAVDPSLLTWARERSGVPRESLARRFKRLTDWERGLAQPTLKQLEDFAAATFVPTGYLLLKTPPKESLPIPDFRTLGGDELPRPSPHLLDTIYDCQSRQEWYRDHAVTNGEPRLPFVGSVSLSTPPVEAAQRMRAVLQFDLPSRSGCATWTEALRLFITHADDAGILVMVNGIVGNNTHRRLDPHEFRGFALADDLAPVVFINGSDTKSAQIFTLAHELSHVWLGASGLDDVEPLPRSRHGVERWCNQVAAEFLVPLAALTATLQAREALADSVPRLARTFKVSTLVILRRLLEVGSLTRDEFGLAYEAELERLLSLPRRDGGNFYPTQVARVSRRFARALVCSTLEGRTLHRDAFQMLGIKKAATFDELVRTIAGAG